MREVIVPGVGQAFLSLPLYFRKSLKYNFNSKVIINDPYTRLYLNYQQQKKELKIYAYSIACLTMFLTLEDKAFMGLVLIAFVEYKYSLFSIYNNIYKLDFAEFIKRYQSEISNSNTPLFYRYKPLTYFLGDQQNRMVTKIEKLKSKEKFQCPFPLIQFINSIYNEDFKSFNYSLF